MPQSKQTHIAIASLNSDLNLIVDDGWRVLLPAGNFRANDGRPHEVPSGWYLDETIANHLIAELARRGADIVGDYEHATLRAKETGEENPASAWLSSHEMRYDDRHGLLIKPRWTKKAKAYLDAREYRFLSPVFGYDKETGHPTFIHSFALTNDPALPGVGELVALASEINHLNSQQSEDNTMDELLMKLLAALEIEVTDEDYESAAQTATDLIKSLKEKKAESLAKDEEIAELTSKIESNDPKRTAEYKALEKAYRGVAKELAVLSSQSGDRQIDAVVDKARTEGRIISAEVDYLKAFGKSHGITALSSMLKGRPALVALSSTQVTEDVVDAAKEAVNEELTPEQLKVMEELGFTKEEFLAYLLEQKKEEEA